VVGLVLAILALMTVITVLEFVTQPDETFGGLMLLGLVAAIWLLPPWPTLLIAAVALTQPAVLEITGQWPALTADFQFIAVAVVTVFGTVAVNALGRVGAEREALIASLTQFTSEAAHELNSPLSAIRVAVDVTLRHPRESERYVASLEQIRDQAVRLSFVGGSAAPCAQGRQGARGPPGPALDGRRDGGAVRPLARAGRTCPGGPGGGAGEWCRALR
jgi:signal transduction histidine kinase